MRKYGLLTYNTYNIGDEIQSLAARQFLPHVDYYVERDNMGRSRNEKFSMILNGYFMRPSYGDLHKYNKYEGNLRKLYARIRGKYFDWPPPENIRPLFISIHIAHNSLCRPKLRGYYKKFEPIGCRDYHTVELFKAIGIEAFFSGCLTLTLRNKFEGKRRGIYFVDPFGSSENYTFPFPGEAGFKNDLWDKFPKYIREKAIYVSHAYYKKDYKQRCKKAQELIDKYSQARLVVTSRFHCALPCIALGTPVVFLYENLHDRRFSGLIDLCTKYSFDDIRRGNYNINWADPDPNPRDISESVSKLREICKRFVTE